MRVDGFSTHTLRVSAAGREISPGGGLILVGMNLKPLDVEGASGRLRRGGVNKADDHCQK